MNAPVLDRSDPREEALNRVEAWLALEQARRKLSGAPGCIATVSERHPTSASPQVDFHYSYDRLGDLVEIAEPDGSRLRFAYDASRRLARVTQPNGETTHYAYEHDRLSQIDDRGLLSRFQYNADGRLVKALRGDEAAVFAYDEDGRLARARTAQVTTAWEYDAAGRTTGIQQSVNGIVLNLRLEYTPEGRLARMRLPGEERPVGYTWDEQGRPATVTLGDQLLACYRFDDTQRDTRVECANSVQTCLAAGSRDGRPRQMRVSRGDTMLLERTYIYNLTGELLEDSLRSYTYDLQGRLTGAESLRGGETWRYAYDAQDNRAWQASPCGEIQYEAAAGRLVALSQTPRNLARTTRTALEYDRWGRRTVKTGPDGEWSYLYDGAGLLREVRRQGDRQARFTYDHKGRLVLAEFAGRSECSERYLYGPADELLAVTDAAGNARRLFVRTPLGALAEVLPGGRVAFRHDDPQGSMLLLTGEDGEIIASSTYDPFGLPAVRGEDVRPAFQGRLFYPEIGLYWFGARWYDPALGCFLTPDSYSGAPDDERLVNPYTPASRQHTNRTQILSEWLKQPRVRNRYAFCGNDPINRVDPNGHWSFGGVLLSLLGAIWTLPNTLFGLLVEVTCLVGEVIRWLVWLVTAGHVSWETPGFDAAASGNLNAFALVFTGGWLGSFSHLLGITFGNVFFVYKDWENSDHIKNMPDPVYPPAYKGKVSIPRSHVLYEHELRHTNQYGWLGPFFHLGMPLFGFYEWDVILHGYRDAWTERDAREHAEPDPTGATVPPGAPGSAPGGAPGSTPGGTPAGTPGGTPGGTPAPGANNFTVGVQVTTRAGNIPVRGVKAQVDTQDLGASNSQGTFTLTPTVGANTFTLKASYENPAEHLRKEEMSFVFSNVDLAAGTYQVAVTNQILKVQDVAGKGDEDFTQNYTLDQTSTSGEVTYDAANKKFTVNVRLATLSLNVPYFNQNSQSDSVTTLPGKDPETTAHSVSPGFTGGILCFPSSVHMLLGYWGANKSRAEVMQKTYSLWADESFSGRADKANDTARSSTPPASPANGKLWLDTSTVTSTGFKLKSFNSSSNSFTELADNDWRVQKGSYKVWTLYAYEQGAVEAFKPAGTEFNGKPDDVTLLNDLPDNILTDVYKPNFRDKLALGLPMVVGTTATAGHIMIMRGAVVDKDGNVPWFIFNDPFGNLAAPGSIYAALGLSDSVGSGGANKPEDVTAVQEVLKAINYYTGAINGACDGTAADATVKAIIKFQKNKMGLSSPDGQVTAGGATEQALNKLDFPSYTSGEGENNSNSSSTEDGLRGKHVYYNENTHGTNDVFEIKGKWRGVVMLKRTTPFTPTELADKLTPGA